MVEIQELINVLRREDDTLAAERPYHLRYFEDLLLSARPTRTFAVVAIRPSRRTEHEWERLIVIAAFRAPFSAILTLAGILAPATLETGIVPLITPINYRSFEGMTWDTPVVRRIMRGFLLYDREGSH